MKDLDLSDSPYINDNYYVPRVSTILSKMIHDDYLMIWANTLGRKGLNHRAVAREATDYGTEVHRRAEILLGEDQEEIDKIKNLNDMNSYIALKSWINDNEGLINVLYSELSLSCPYFGGTMDLVYQKDGKTILLDFKTSKVITYKYFLQLAAYEYMLNTKMNIHVDAIEVLHLSKISQDYHEYILDLSNPEHAAFHAHNVETFLSLVYAYWNINTADNMFHNIQDNIRS
jgi:hypothetical protein